MRRRVPRLARPLLAVAAVAVLAGTWLAAGDAVDAAEAKTVPAPQPLLLVPEDIVTVATAMRGEGIPVTGTLEPLRRTTVHARIGALVDEVLVREGERVRAGQPLLRQDTRDVAAQLRQAEAQLEQARVELQLTEAYEARKKTLHEQKYLSDVDWATAQGETAVRRSQLKVAEAAAAIARKSLADTTLVAPIAGVVAERHVEPGTLVMPGQALLGIVDLAELELAAAIPARDVARVRIGSEVTFTVEGQAGRTFRGKVVRINPMAGGARTITLYARVDNRDGALRGGVFASGRIAAGATAARGLHLPAGAVRRVDGKEQVWVIRAGKLALQPVVLGARDGASGLVEVKQGLAAGEQVVLTDIGARQPGLPVSVSAPR